MCDLDPCLEADTLTKILVAPGMGREAGISTVGVAKGFNRALSLFLSIMRAYARRSVLPDNGCTYTHVFTVDANATHYHTHFHM